MATTAVVAWRSAFSRTSVKLDLLGFCEDEEAVRPFARWRAALIEGAVTLRVSPLGERTSCPDAIDEGGNGAAELKGGYPASGARP